MKRIFLDIETLPTVEENRRFVEEKLRRSLERRGEVLSEAEFAAKAENALRETALQGSLGRLLCIGLMVDDRSIARKPCVCGQEKNTGEFHLDERRTLTQFWRFLDAINFDPRLDVIVGHNILGFDLPFLYHRSMVCGVKPSWQLLNDKPWEIEKYIADTMEMWRVGKYKQLVGLEELALAFGLDCPKTGAVCGGNLSEAFLAGKHREIREYCLADVRCVRELYYRMTFRKMPSESAPEKVGNIAPAV